jgi:H+/Cl- antiporter ClcA
MLTAFTLGCGIRGGEIAPTIFIGATGCFSAGCLIGLDPSLAAAVGIVGALASVTNCPVALWIYGLEAICLSGEMALYFAIAACMAHFLSGRGGLYSEQQAERQFLKPASYFPM